MNVCEIEEESKEKDESSMQTYSHHNSMLLNRKINIYATKSTSGARTSCILTYSLTR
jgi:hypothetical protein